MEQRWRAEVAAHSAVIITLADRRPEQSRSASGEPDLLRSRIGRVLRERRQASGKRLVDVAQEAGVSPSHLSDIERGRKEASSEVLRAVHRSLGVDLDDVLRGAVRGDSGPVELAA